MKKGDSAYPSASHVQHKKHHSSFRRTALFVILYLVLAGAGFGIGIGIAKAVRNGEPIYVPKVTLPLELPDSFGAKQNKEGGELYMDNDRVEDLYTIFGSVAKTLATSNVWLSGETLLGEVRHRPSGPMRWSEALTMGAFKKDEEAIKAALKGNRDLEVEDADHGRVKITSSSPKYSNSDDKATLFISFYAEKGENSGFTAAGSSKDVVIFKSESDILPLRSCKLWDIDAKCPHKTSTVISNTFGNKAFEIVESPFNKKTYNITDPTNHNLILPLMSQALVEKLQFGTWQPILSGKEFLSKETKQ
jgi:hypothetical protein